MTTAIWASLWMKCARGGAVIPLRAMVTPTSRGWTLAALLAELNREHEHVGGQA